MTLDCSKLQLVDHVKEAGLKLSHLSRRGSHTHGLLTSTQQNVLFVIRDDGIVNGTIRPVRLQVLPVDRVVKLGGKVGRRGNQEGLVHIEADAVDLFLMRLNLILHITRFWVVQFDPSMVKGDENFLVHGSPQNIGGHHALGGGFRQVHHQHGLVAVRARVLRFGHFVDGNLGRMVHKGVTDGGKLLTALGPDDTTDGPRVRKGSQAFSCFDIPQTAGRIG